MPPMNNRLMRPRARRPDAPRILTADSIVGITWTTPASNGAGITEFRIYEGGELLEVVTGGETQWPYAPSAGLSYQVSAVNAVGEGPKSKAVVAT